MLTVITIINYIDRGAIAYAGEFIIEEYGLDLKSWGQILGFFGYGYMLGGLFGGILADKKGAKFLWIIAVTTWSLFEIVTAFAGDIGLTLFGGSALIGFAVFRILFGAAEGPSFTAINRTVANWSAPGEKAFLLSLGHVGVPIGALLTAPVAVFLISIVGWKGMFVVLGVLGLIWVLVWAKIFTDYPENHPRVSKEELAEIRSSEELLESENALEISQHTNTSWYHFFKNPTLVLNALGYFGTNYVSFLILTWTPIYLQDVFHYNLSSLWYLGMIPWIGACITCPLGAKLSDLLRQKTNNLRLARTGISIISYFLTAVCFLIILTVHSPGAVLFLMFLGTSFTYLNSTLFWAIVLDTEPSRAGAYGGILHFFGAFASLLAPTLTGFLVMNYGYTSMFISVVVAALFTMVCMVFVKPGKRVKEKFSSESQEVSLN
ncbi:MFS transporter [Metabacillus arenae]|uniref:MFS transporter n=1 Tax=Metabacillus arenae TaxID=2771434 RepID=A0A926NCH9_9BACI|nr:MFS transporter [Metabacillus arenae]MBD1380984.1 MFS transporter [Metabacillus arenae]